MISKTPAATVEARAKLAEIERQRQEAVKLWDAIHGKDLKAVAALMNDEFRHSYSPDDGRDPDLEAEARRQPGGPDAAEFERSL